MNNLTNNPLQETDLRFGIVTHDNVKKSRTGDNIYRQEKTADKKDRDSEMSYVNVYRMLETVIQARRMFSLTAI